TFMKKLLTFFGERQGIPHSSTIYLFLVLLLALSARIAYLNVIIEPNAYPYNIDSIEHHLIAQNLVEGNGYSMYGHPTAYRAPFLSYFMALCYWIFGVNFAVVRIGIIMMSLLLIWVIYLLAKEFFNGNVGIWAALLAGVYPHFIFYNSRILTETPFALFSLLALLFFVKFFKTESRRNLVLTALFLALAILSRPVGLALLGFLLLALLYKQRLWKNVKHALILVVLVSLFISPWIIRNYQVFDRFVPVTTQGGVVLWISNNHYVAHHPALAGWYMFYQHLPGARKLITNSETERSRYGYQFFKQFLKEHPGDIPRLIWYKNIRFWEKESFTGSSRRWMYELAYFSIIFLALGGIMVALFSGRSSLFYLSILFLANFVPALIFWSGARVRMPAEPALIILAAFFIEKIRVRLLK
ncbi:MAG: glycosyltransferase family 39 protein, partial [Calditrichia bacterium]|nr:glycosyltransferase family 39 protein [Calditrichia bacterium]